MLVTNDLSGNGKGVGFTSSTEVIEDLTSATRTSGARVLGSFNASLKGTFVATVRLVKSYDNGLTYSPVTAGGLVISYTGPVEELFAEPEFGVLYAWECTDYTSGTINTRISQ